MGIARFLEIITPTEDIQESLEFYARLGFTEVAVGDIRTHFYAVVSDGRTAIGLHGGGFGEPALSFVQPDLARHTRKLADQDANFAFRRLSQEEFNEVGVRSPDQHLLVFLEAATFSLAQCADVEPPIPGRITEISLRCANLMESMAFWEQAGCITDEEPEGKSVNLYAIGVNLGLRIDSQWHEPLLRFEPVDAGRVMKKLECLNITTQSVPGGVVVTAPEGTRLLIIT